MSLLLAPFGAFAIDCQATLDEYLDNLEHAAWFSNNALAADPALIPFLSKAEQTQRQERFQRAANLSYLALKKQCFSEDFDLTTDCSSRWIKVKEYSNLVGVSLSRLDTLNRNPVPIDEPLSRTQYDQEFLQQRMEQIQLTARANLTRFRQMRNKELDAMGPLCFQAELPFYAVNDGYFLGHVQDSAGELIRERFKQATVPTEQTLKTGAYECRWIFVNGERTGQVNFDTTPPSLQTTNYQICADGKSWVLSSDIPGSLPIYQFEPFNGLVLARLYARNALNQVAYMRVGTQNDLYLEIVSLSQPSITPVGAISDNTMGPVSTYWSCKLR